MKHLPPSGAGSFLYLVPAVVVVLAWALLGEIPTALSVAGGGLVVAGVVIVQRPRTGPRGRVSVTSEQRGRPRATGDPPPVCAQARRLPSE
jgi:drug/metabolite transporter (DMT)-like permease